MDINRVQNEISVLEDILHEKNRFKNSLEKTLKKSKINKKNRSEECQEQP